MDEMLGAHMPRELCAEVVGYAVDPVVCRRGDGRMIHFTKNAERQRVKFPVAAGEQHGFRYDADTGIWTLLSGSGTYRVCVAVEDAMTTDATHYSRRGVTVSLLVSDDSGERIENRYWTAMPAAQNNIDVRPVGPSEDMPHRCWENVTLRTGDRLVVCAMSQYGITCAKPVDCCIKFGASSARKMVPRD